MTLPVEVGMSAKEHTPVASFDLDEMTEALTKAPEPCIYAQIAERRSQLEDAETLRRVRAL